MHISDGIQPETNPPGLFKPFGWWCARCGLMHKSPNTAMGSCQRNHPGSVWALYQREPSGPLFITEAAAVSDQDLNELMAIAYEQGREAPADRASTHAMTCSICGKHDHVAETGHAQVVTRDQLDAALAPGKTATPCPDCGGTRFIQRPGDHGPSTCLTCVGQPDAATDPQYDDPKYWTQGEGRRAWDRLKARVTTLEDRLWLYEQTVTNVMSELGDLGEDIDTGLVDVVAEASERGIGVVDVMRERVSDVESGADCINPPQDGITPVGRTTGGSDETVDGGGRHSRTDTRSSTVGADAGQGLRDKAGELPGERGTAGVAEALHRRSERATELGPSVPDAGAEPWLTLVHEAERIFDTERTRTHSISFALRAALTHVARKVSSDSATDPAQLNEALRVAALAMGQAVNTMRWLEARFPPTNLKSDIILLDRGLELLREVHGNGDTP